MIGIIGGAGPEASAKLYRRILEACVSRGLFHDWEFPHLLIDSVPFSDLIQGRDLCQGRAQFDASLKRLRQAGADPVFVNCNSLFAVIREEDGVVNLPRETCRALRATGTRRAALLATSTTIAHG